MADKIDPALAQLAKQNPLHGFQQGKDIVVCTSTGVARISVSGEKDTTARLYASIAAEYARLGTESTYRLQKEKFEHLKLLYGKSIRTIQTALSFLNKST